MSPTNLHTFDYFWPETTAVIPTSCPSQLREMFNRLPCFERTKSPQQKTFCLGKDLNQQLISIDPIKSAIWNYLGVHWSSMFIVIVVVVMVGPLEKMSKKDSKTKDEQWAGHKFSTSAKNKQNRQQNQQMYVTERSSSCNTSSLPQLPQIHPRSSGSSDCANDIQKLSVSCWDRCRQPGSAGID